MNDRFPLFKLPFVALKNAIKIMEIPEVIDLSLTSKRSKNKVKSSIPNDQLKVLVPFSNNSEIEVQTEKCGCRGKSECCFTTIKNVDLMEKRKYLKHEIKENEEEDQMKNESMSFKWIKIWTEYLCDVLNCDIDYLTIDVGVYEGRLSEISRFLNFHQPSIKIVELKGIFSDTDEYFSFFESCNITDVLLIFPSKENGTKPFNFKFTVRNFLFEFRDGPVGKNWITMDEVMKFECQQIIMGQCSFNDNDLNRFLKSWINGSNFELNFMTLTLPNYNIQNVLDGIEFVERDESVVRSYLCSGGKIVKVNGGFDIKRNDGTIATITPTVYHVPQNNEQSFTFFSWNNGSI